MNPFVAIVLNRGKDPDLGYTRGLVSRLTSRGCGVRLPDELSGEFAGTRLVSFGPAPDYMAGAAAVIVLGGDGTILSIASFCAQRELPVLGINLGTVGFMAELEKDEPFDPGRLLSGDCRLEERMMLETLIDGKDPLYSLNECCVLLDHGFHILTTDLFLGEKKLCEFKADGLIFSTPTGSTGYSFSAGGAVVDSQLDSIGVKAICPYLLNNAHHFLFRPDTVLTVRNIRTHSGRVYASSDGREEREVTENSVLTVRRAEKPLLLVRFGDRSNFEAFFKKF